MLWERITSTKFNSRKSIIFLFLGYYRTRIVGHKMNGSAFPQDSSKMATSLLHRLCDNMCGKADEEQEKDRRRACAEARREAKRAAERAQKVCHGEEDCACWPPSESSVYPRRARRRIAQTRGPCATRYKRKTQPMSAAMDAVVVFLMFFDRLQLRGTSKAWI